MPASALEWTVLLHHCPSDCHLHTIQTMDDVTSGSFAAPDHEYPSWIELKLTATDSLGLQGSASVLLYPQTVPIALATSPVRASALLGLALRRVAHQHHRHRRLDEHVSAAVAPDPERQRLRVPLLVGRRRRQATTSSRRPRLRRPTRRHSFSSRRRRRFRRRRPRSSAERAATGHRDPVRPGAAVRRDRRAVERELAGGERAVERQRPAGSDVGHVPDHDGGRFERHAGDPLRASTETASRPRRSPSHGRPNIPPTVSDHEPGRRSDVHRPRFDHDPGGRLRLRRDVARVDFYQGSTLLGSATPPAPSPSPGPASPPATTA